MLGYKWIRTVSEEFTQQPSLWGDDPVIRKPNRTSDGQLACAYGRPWRDHLDCSDNGCCDTDGNEIPLNASKNSPP